jgi:hypothetical protein
MDKIDGSNFYGDPLVGKAIIDLTNSREPEQLGGAITKIKL